MANTIQNRGGVGMNTTYAVMGENGKEVGWISRFGNDWQLESVHYLH